MDNQEPHHEIGADLRRKEAAEYLSQRYFACAPQTLSRLAWEGAGPRFSKIGNTVPRYSKQALDEWAKDRLGPYRLKAEAKLETIAA